MKGLRGDRSTMMRGGLPSGRGTVKIRDWKQGWGGQGTRPLLSPNRGLVGASPDEIECTVGVVIEVDD